MIFKTVFVVLLAYGLFLLKDLTDTLKLNGRFQATEGVVTDTRTGNQYIWEEYAGWSFMSPEGNYKRVKNLPK